MARDKGKGDQEKGRGETANGETGKTEKARQNEQREETQETGKANVGNHLYCATNDTGVVSHLQHIFPEVHAASLQSVIPDP